MNRFKLSKKIARAKVSCGFTLVEVLLVCVLISLFMVISVPLFSTLGSNSLNKSVLRINGTIKYLFNEAVITGQEHLLVFDISQGTYSAKVKDPNGELEDLPNYKSIFFLETPTRFLDIDIPGRGKFSMGQVTIMFHSSGWVEEAFIYIEDDKNEVMTIHIIPVTGTTEIFQGYKTL